MAAAGEDRDAARREPGTAAVALSAIVPLFRDRSDVVEVYEAYKAALESLGRPYELIYVLSWQSERALADLKALKQRGEDALVLVVGQQVDEAEALLSGFERARGEIVLTLPADLQVEPADIPKVVLELERCEVAVGRRPPTSSTLQRIQAKAFHGLLKLLFGHTFTDLVCRVRAWRRPVTEEIRAARRAAALPAAPGERARLSDPRGRRAAGDQRARRGQAHAAATGSASRSISWRFTSC